MSDAKKEEIINKVFDNHIFLAMGGLDGMIEILQQNEEFLKKQGWDIESLRLKIDSIYEILMKPCPKNIKEIIEILEENPQLKIVSYNLAPRPNGFCYEYDDSYYGECAPRVIERFESLLSSIKLSESETNILRNYVFGSII